jgi:hypothetical protein
MLVEGFRLPVVSMKMMIVHLAFAVLAVRVPMKALIPILAHVLMDIPVAESRLPAVWICLMTETTAHAA